MRRKEGNKEADILAAAIRIFARDGFHQAKILHIAEAADVSVGTVYLYFENKNHLLRKIFESLWDSLLTRSEALVNDPSLDPLQKIDGIVDVVFDSFSQNPSLGAVFQKDMHLVQRPEHPRFGDYLNRFMRLGEKILREGQSRGIFHPETDARVTVTFIFGGLRFSINQWTLNPVPENLELFRAGVKRLLKGGLSLV